MAAGSKKSKKAGAGGGGQKKKMFQKLKEAYNSDESEEEVSFSEEDYGDSDFEYKPNAKK